VARAWLREQRAAVGIANPDQELRLISIKGPDELGMTHVMFAHFHQGVRVFGSDLIVHMKGNLVTSMNGVYLRSLHETGRVLVGAHDAGNLAMDYLEDLLNTGDANLNVADRAYGLGLDRTPELVWYNHGLVNGGTTRSELAWRTEVNSYVTFVSAVSGHILDSYDNIHSGMIREVYDTKHSTNLPGALVCSESKGCTSSDEDTINAWDQFKQTYDYFKNVHNRDSWDNKGGKLMGTVHYSTNYQNAYWNGTQMVFGDGFVGLDVTAHELGHAVCQATANLTYKSQSGALNESYSDVWGAMVDREDWQIGEDIPIGVIRDMSDPNAYGQPKDMDEYKNYIFYDNGGVHINSGIPNYACYLASDGGANNGVTVKGQGRDKVEKVWYRAESTKLTSSSKFADFATAAIASCGELYGGTTSTVCKEFENAMKATGMK
jgi:Zn-dependent metalloprotease